MATIFGLTANMDIKTLAHVVELRNKDGLHVDYKYGLRVGGRYDWDFPFPSPKYDGCSIRLFIYNNVSSMKMAPGRRRCEEMAQTSECVVERSGPLREATFIAQELYQRRDERSKFRTKRPRYDQSPMKLRRDITVVGFGNSSTAHNLQGQVGHRLWRQRGQEWKAKIRIALERNPAYYYASIEVRGTIAYVSYSNGKRQRGLETSEGSIGLGKYFSIGLRMDGNLFRPLLHKQLVQQLDMKIPVNQYNWNAKIYSGENYILSLHICDEVGKNFPPRGLNERYAFGFVLPIGSYVTVFAVFAGGTPDGQRIWIGFQQDSDQYVGHSYPDVPMKANEEFRISARNSNGGWLLATSFLGGNQNTAVVGRTNQEQFTDVQVSNNCFIRRILAVSAAIPEQYRPK